MQQLQRPSADVDMVQDVRQIQARDGLAACCRREDGRRCDAEHPSVLFVLLR